MDFPKDRTVRNALKHRLSSTTSSPTQLPSQPVIKKPSAQSQIAQAIPPFFRIRPPSGPRPQRMILLGRKGKDHLGRDVHAAVSSRDYGSFFNPRSWWRGGVWSRKSTVRTPHERECQRRLRQRRCVHYVESPDKHQRLPNGMYMIEPQVAP